MNRLFMIDKKDYDENMPHSKRPSVRAVIFRGDKLAMVYSKRYNYYKFPGGGIEDGENQQEALIREVREEVGLEVIPESIAQFGSVLRLQLSDFLEDTIFEQENFYYYCQVKEKNVQQNLDEYEAEEGFCLQYVTLDEAIETNRNQNHNGYDEVMIEREAKVLERLRADRNESESAK